MASDVVEPLNIGSDESVSLNQLVTVVEEIAGVRLQQRYARDAPKGVRGRSSERGFAAPQVERTSAPGWRIVSCQTPSGRNETVLIGISRMARRDPFGVR